MRRYHEPMIEIVISGERGPTDVVVECGCLARLGDGLDQRGVQRPSLAVTNSTVAPLHGRFATETVGAPPPYVLPDGEIYKRWDQVAVLVEEWLEAGLHRGDSVLAVGGGVVTDTVGFAAAVYLRGIQWLAVPTTLLAMVDASVGGKTGINLEVGKNLVGAFWAPRMVAVDPETLATLPARELRAGLAEVVKAAWIADHDMLGLLEGPVESYGSLSSAGWEELIARAIGIKAGVVEADEREAGARKALNLGHTLGHGLEAVTDYRRFLHGEAVGWGMLAATRLARRRALLSEESALRLGRAIAVLGVLPPIDDLDVGQVLQAIARDKKRDDRGVGWVLPTDGGVVLDQRVSADELREVLTELHEKA